MGAGQSHFCAHTVLMSDERPQEPIAWHLLEQQGITRRVLKTLLSQRPKKHAVFFMLLLVLPCMFLSVLSWQNPAIYEAFAVSGEALLNGKQWYRLMTSLFLHGDPGHLISNTYMLIALSIFIFGQLIESVKGGFLLMFFLLLGGGLVNYLTVGSYPPEIRLIGISGLVYLAAGFWFINYLLIDRRRTFKARFLRTAGVALIILFPTTFEATTSYLAHFHGFWLGLVMGGVFFYLNKTAIRSHEVVKLEFPEEEVIELVPETAPDTFH